MWEENLLPNQKNVWNYFNELDEHCFISSLFSLVETVICFVYLRAFYSFNSTNLATSSFYFKSFAIFTFLIRFNILLAWEENYQRLANFSNVED